MANVVYIDLSAKVEQWSLSSAIAVSNERYWVYLVPGRVKQRIRQEFTQRHGTKNLQFRVLAFLVYVAVRENLADIQQIVIDQDYSGAQAESTIKNYLLRWLRMERPGVKAGFVRFENIKGSRADTMARTVFKNKARPDRRISERHVKSLLKK